MIGDIFGIPASIEIGATTTALVAGIGAAVGLLQYANSERWKKAEFAVAQVRLLATDPTLAFCCRAIDWGGGPLFVPDRYRALFGALPVEQRDTFDHDWGLMAAALRPRIRDLPAAEPQRSRFLIYRYAFDELFGYLDTIAMYRASDVISGEELDPIDDYVRQLRFPAYWRGQLKDVTTEQVFGDFAQAFYGKRVWPWMCRFERPAGPEVRQAASLPSCQVFEPPAKSGGRER